MRITTASLPPEDSGSELPNYRDIVLSLSALILKSLSVKQNAHLCLAFCFYPRFAQRPNFLGIGVVLKKYRIPFSALGVAKPSNLNILTLKIMKLAHKTCKYMCMCLIVNSSQVAKPPQIPRQGHHLLNGDCSPAKRCKAIWIF